MANYNYYWINPKHFLSLSLFLLFIFKELPFTTEMLPQPQKPTRQKFSMNIFQQNKATNILLALLLQNIYQHIKRRLQVFTLMIHFLFLFSDFKFFISLVFFGGDEFSIHDTWCYRENQCTVDGLNNSSKHEQQQQQKTLNIC